MALQENGTARNATARIVIGLLFGDEGKGSWVDHLIRKHGARYVVRFNGGSQAAHHVVTPAGQLHCFRQFGSGMFVSGVQTILSRFMLVDPEHLFEEASDLEGKGVEHPLKRLIVSAEAPVISPFNRLLNQIQEIYRGGGKHGSCGYGIGITQRDVDTLGDDALYVKDFAVAGSFAFDKLRRIWLMRMEEAKQYVVPENAALCRTLASVDLGYYEELFRYFCQRVNVLAENELLSIIRRESTVFEGAQGVMLDQNYGTFPYCTRSNCTFENALTVLHEAGFEGEIIRTGLVRGYATRHGAGPFVTGDSAGDPAGEHADEPELVLPACHNSTNRWQDDFRVGWFDAVAVRYALKVVGGVDFLAVTNLDRMDGLSELKVASGYRNTAGYPAFFAPDGEMLVPERHNSVPAKLDLLRARSAALDMVMPEYVFCPGWKQDGESAAEIATERDRENARERGIRNYLSFLSGLVGQPIGAYSDVADCQKTYL